MVQCDKTNRRKTLDEFALEAEGNEEEASLSLFDLLCIGIGGTVGEQARLWIFELIQALTAFLTRSTT